MNQKNICLTTEEARQILHRANSISWHNLGAVVYNLGVLENDWGRHDNDKWIPNYNQAWRDYTWLQLNAEKVFEALNHFRNSKNG